MSAVAGLAAAAAPRGSVFAAAVETCFAGRSWHLKAALPAVGQTAD